MTTTTAPGHSQPHLHQYQHTRPGHHRLCTLRYASILFAFVVMILIAPSGRAFELGKSFFLAGIGSGRIEGPVRDTDMTTYYGILNHKINDGLTALDMRGTYTYGDATAGSMNDGDLNLFVSFPKIPIVKPFVIGGLSYDKFSLPRDFNAEQDWDLGYNLGVGAEVHVIPALPITGMAIYTSGHYERVNYILDATFWVTKFGIGAYLNYQHGQGDFGDNDVKQGSVYIALRF